MSKPTRIQLSRKKGFNLQAASLALNGLPAINCARPSRWGNPFRVGIDGDVKQCVELFRANWPQDAVTELRGKNLACYCELGTPCHCDVLLEVANRI